MGKADYEVVTDKKEYSRKTLSSLKTHTRFSSQNF
jgi:hypothetical protein